MYNNFALSEYLLTKNVKSQISKLNKPNPSNCIKAIDLIVVKVGTNLCISKYLCRRRPGKLAILPKHANTQQCPTCELILINIVIEVTFAFY